MLSGPFLDRTFLSLSEKSKVHATQTNFCKIFLPKVIPIFCENSLLVVGKSKLDADLASVFDIPYFQLESQKLMQIGQIFVNYIGKTVVALCARNPFFRCTPILELNLSQKQRYHKNLPSLHQVWTFQLQAVSSHKKLLSLP